MSYNPSTIPFPERSPFRILEYLAREDADRAVKELDGKDLRGRPVRVTFDDSVSVPASYIVPLTETFSRSALVLITIAVMTVVMIGVMTATEKTAMIDTAGIVLDPLPVVEVPITMIVAQPGLHPQGGTMIEGLQGTMITGAEAMMTADHLIIMMTVVGMIKTKGATIEGVTTKKNAMKNGPPGTRTEKDGLVEDFCEKRVCRKRTSFNGRFRFVFWTPIVMVLSSFTRTVYFSIGWSTLGVA